MTAALLQKIQDLDPEQFSHLPEPLRDCRLCPRNCGADRFSADLGYCNSDASFYISSICVHRGEEPPISGPHGICNVFFGHCNLQCVYCQNHQISNNCGPRAARRWSLREVLQEIVSCLDAGCEGVGFVSPSHVVPQVKVIVNALHELGLKPVIVYNTNGYDTLHTLRDIESLVDVYLPDFKYTDGELARKYSGAANYPGIAAKALKEMYRQKGSSLLLNERGVAERGILIRHLVLPGHVENSIGVLRFIAEEVSTSLHISLMSQYHPAFRALTMPPIHRPLYKEEYDAVVDAFYGLGLRNGYFQEMDSFENYRPDFDKGHPFED